MRIITNKNIWLPKQCRKYEDPDTGEIIKGDTFKQLYMRTRKHRLDLQLEVYNLESQLEEWVCSKVGPHDEYCRQAESNMMVRKPLKEGYGFQDVINFTNAVKDTIIHGAVSQETANDRADVCANCPYNMTLPGCSTCAGVSRMAANTVFGFLGKKTVRQEDHLKQCGICGCALTAKVWVPRPKDNPQVKKHEEDFPVWCWVRNT